MTLHVLYLTGHPAEAQLSAPIMRRMKADPFFKLNVWDVMQRDPEKIMSTDFFEAVAHADCVVSPCDRLEMMYPTFRAFLMNKPIIRIYAGINTSGGTHDDVIRRMLDAMGHLLLTESEECRANLIRQGEEEWRCPPPVGITHFDDVEVDLGLVPTPWTYGMLLMNPVTISKEKTVMEATHAAAEALQFLGRSDTHHLFVFPPNGDTYSSDVNEILTTLLVGIDRVHSYLPDRRVPRPQFLGLLKMCVLFISNSSSVLYEANALGVPTLNPSWRNMERTKPPRLEPGGSDKIVAVLKSINWDDKDKLLRKRFRY